MSNASPLATPRPSWPASLRATTALERRPFARAGAVVLIALVALAVGVAASSSSNEEAVRLPLPADQLGSASSWPVSDGRNGAPLMLAGGRPLFPLGPSGSLSGVAGAAFEGHGVTIGAQEGSGVWLTSADSLQRVYAVIPDEVVSRSGMRAEAFVAGSRVNLSGRMAAEDGLGLGLAVESALTVNGQGQVIAVNSVRPLQ